MNKHSGVSLFLIELVIMLTVFVTAAAIDTLMLVKSNNLSRASSELDRAVECAVSAAESYKATGGGAAAGMTDAGGTWTAYYDSLWNPAEKPGAKYTMTMTESGGSADIDVENGGGSIYSLTVKAADYEG